MGRVFIEETMINSGVNRVDIIGLLAFIKRSGRATSATDAIRRLESGEFDVAELQELMIQQYETKRPETVNSETDVDKQINAGVAQLVEQLTCNEKVEGSNPFSGTTDKCPIGGIGRRTGFRYQRAIVGVRVPHWAP